MKIDDVLIERKKDFGKTARNVEISDTGDSEFPMRVTFTPPPTSNNRVQRGYWWATPTYQWTDRNRKTAAEIQDIALRKIFAVKKVPANAIGRTTTAGDKVSVTVNPKFMGGPWSGEYTEYPSGGHDDLTIRKWFAMAKANADRLNATKGRHERKPDDKRRDQLRGGVDDYYEGNPIS